MNHLIILGGLLLSGCAATEPDLRAGEWHPVSVNTANLAVMVANPHDLQQGVSPGPDETDGQMAVAAIDRLHHAKLKDIEKLSTNGGGSGSGGS